MDAKVRDAKTMTPSDPVTVVITRRVKAGRQADYESWLAQLQQDARGLPGNLGVTTQRPTPGGPPEYVSAVRFASLNDLRAFERSEVRRLALLAVAPLVEGDAAWHQLSGLEFWFTPPPGTVVPQPSRERMVVLLIGVVFFMVMGIGELVSWLAGQVHWDAPYALRLLLTISLEVPLLTYWVMPRLTRHLAHWIYTYPAKVA
jgi:antibiotic biosynthesis monooxygenase (ABM) superfamily enzyme